MTHLRDWEIKLDCLIQNCKSLSNNTKGDNKANFYRLLCARLRVTIHLVLTKVCKETEAQRR